MIDSLNLHRLRLFLYAWPFCRCRHHLLVAGFFLLHAIAGLLLVPHLFLFSAMSASYRRPHQIVADNLSAFPRARGCRAEQRREHPAGPMMNLYLLNETG